MPTVRDAVNAGEKPVKNSCLNYKSTGLSGLREQNWGKQVNEPNSLFDLSAGGDMPSFVIATR